MAITLDELRRQVKAEESVNTQKASPKMTLEELRKTVGTTAPQTAGEVSPAVPVYTQPAFTEPAVPKKTVQQIYWENMHSGIEETDSMADRAEKLKSVIPEQKKKTGLPDVLNYQGIYNRQKAKEAAERIAKPAGNVLGGAMGAVNFAGELIDTAALNTVGGIATGIQAGAQSISGQRGQAMKRLLDEGRNARLGADAGMHNKRLVDDLQKARKEEKLDKDAFGVQLLDEANKKATNLMKDMNPTEQFLTQTMMSVLENAYLMPLGLINPAAAGAALAASATGRSTYDSAKEGKNLSEAFTRGVIDGSIEMATEKIGVDAWLDILTGKGGGLIKNLAKQAGSEGIEEGMSYLAGWLMDVVQNNPDAKFSAQELLTSFSLQELLTSAAGGALSGLMLGGGTAAMVGKDNYIRMRNDETSRQAEQAEQRVEIAANATNTVRMKEEMLENPTAGISDFGEQGKPFDVSKLPQVRKQQIENPVESINDRGENTGKPFDIKQLPQQQKTAPQAVETENNKQTPVNKNQPVKVNYGLADYVKTLPETAGKNAQLHLNKQYGDSGMTAGQFIESNIDGRFFEENKKYFFEKDGRKTPVRKSMYEYALWLQSSAKDSNVPGKIDTDTNVDAKAVETVSERYSQHLAEKEQGRYVRQNTRFKQTMYNGFAIEKVGDNYIVWDNQTNQIAVTKPTLKGIKEALDKWENSLKNRTATVTETVEEKPTVDTTGYGNAKVIGKKGNIDILDSVPDGWKRFDMTTAPVGYVGVTNNKSLFGGERRHALVPEDIFRGSTEKSAIIENRITENTVSTHLEATLNTVAYEKEYGKLSNEEKMLYNAGKNGDTDRAVQLADKIVSENNINRLKSHGNDVYLLGITKAEDIAKNKNGVVFTGYLSSKTGQKIFSGIYQDVENSTKGNSVWERMKIPFPKFDISDDISYSDIKGKKFILVDDNVTTGRSFIGLKMFIEENGGTVVDLYAPTKGQDASEKITVTDETWAEIKADIDGIVEFSKKESIKREISQKGLSEREGQELLKQYKRFSEGKNEQNSRTSYEGDEGNSGSTEKTGRKEKSIENNKKGTSKDVSNSLPENKKAEKKARQKKEKATENKITDFGEKIGGARKDDWRDRGLDVNDIAGMTDKEKAKFITKDNIWKKPNYEALIKEGKDKNVTYFLKTVRDGLPTKPEFRTTNKELARQVQEEYVKQMREFTDLVMSLDTKEKVMNAFDEVLVKGGYITKDSSKLYAPWHPTEKGKHIFTEKLFNAFRNAEGVNGWRYLSNKVQKDQFGVPSSEKIPKGYSLTEFDDGWAVLKGYKVINKEFATRESALSWLKENTKRTKNNRFVPPSVERVRREGVDVRQGAEVTGEMLQKRYGFHGGEFGNWTNQKERQMNLNFAFDAFHDLARALGISEKDVSLGGKLSIAFGARGKGGAKSFAAHYEPLYEVINLTRMKGAGSLGHEWAHALDDILGTKAIGKAFTKSRGAYQAYDNLLETMKWRNATADELAEMNEKTKNQYVGYAQSWLNGPFPKSTLDKMTEHQKSEFEALKTAFLSGEKGSVDKLNELHKEVTGRVIPKETRDRLHMYESTWLQPEYGHRTEARVKTDFIKGSEWFDEFESRGEDYWRSDVEIFARAFHTYLLDKTEGKSDYLNASAERCALPDLKTGKIYRAYPYGEERTAINKAFDEFFAALKKDGYLTTQEYDAGEMISYSTDGAKVTMEGKIVIEPKKEKAPESKRKLVPEKFAREQAKKAEDGLPESVGAMKSGYYAAVDEYGAFPEGEKVTNPVDVPMSVDGVHGVTRGVRTIMEAAATKEDMLSDYETAIANGEFNYDINRDKDAVEKAVAYIEKYGFENTYNEWQKKVDNKQTITKDDMTQAQIMYASAVAEGDYDIAMKLATDISIQATKAGQVVHSMRILKKTTPEGRLYYAQKSVEAIQDDVNEKYGDKAPELKVPQELLDNLKKAKTDEEIRKATAEINQAIADQLPFSWSNFINSWRYLAMLGNTRTQVRNVLSNCIGTVAQEYTHFVQAAIEDTALKGKADRTSTLKAPTQAQVDYATRDYETMKDSLAGKGKYKNDSLSALQSMKNPFEIVGTWGKQGDEYIGLKGVIRKGGDKTMKVLSAWNNATNWAMDKGDQIFSERAYKRFFARYLAANNINPENITNSQLFKARNWATKQALESVYRENNDFANAISKAESKWSKSDKLLKKAGGVALGGLMPFKSTPMNITKRAFEYTPAGIVLEAMQQAYSNKTKGQAYDMPEIINKAAKSLSGTSLILLGAFLAKAGVLTGGLGDDKEDKMKKQMGQQAYSINIGDWSYTLDWGGAGMMPLFVGADIYQSNSEDDDWLMNIGNALANAGSPIIETSMMTGFMDALQSMAYEDNEIKKAGTALASALSNYLGQMVPTLFGQVARAVDDTSRSSYTNAKGVFKPIAKTAQKMQNKIPGLSQKNVPYMDVWGNDVKNVGGNTLGRLAYNMLSPGYAEKKSTDKVETMLTDLYDKTGDTSVLPSNYTTYKRMGDETIRFTDKQFEQYTKTYGQAAYDILEDLSGDKGFKSMKDAYKAEVIEKAYRYSTAIASNEVVDKALEVRQKNQKKALEKGVSAYYVFGGLIEADGMGSEGNANGTLSKSEVMAYIESRGGLSKTEKAYLFAALGNSNWKNPYA